MPCDSIRLTGVQLEKCDPGHMTNGLRSLGLSPWIDQAAPHVIHFGNGEKIDCKTGKGQFGTFRDLNEIKRAYSASIVQATAKKFGWTAQATKQVEGLAQTTYTRR